jgi:hypothetical protein
MHSTMKSVGVTSVVRPALVGRRWPWFARFLRALHRSRRKAAQREIARYHDMIDLERRYDALERLDGNIVWRRGTLPFQGP